MFLVFSFQYVKERHLRITNLYECTNPQFEILLEYQSRTDSYSRLLVWIALRKLIQQYVNKERILIFLLRGGERGRTDDLLNANQAL